MSNPIISTCFSPEGLMGVLSKREVAHLLDNSQGGLFKKFRNCALAVLNCGTPIDDSTTLAELYQSFDIHILEQERGIVLQLSNAPIEAFVEDDIIQGIREHLVSVVRDILYGYELMRQYNLNNPEEITDAVFHILRNAGILQPKYTPNLIVCWGGHTIKEDEYLYSKEVGYQLGLRHLDVCTGCGPGAMKGPMKGATIGRAKQRAGFGRYIGFTEPGIIAAESPNPIVNELVILPDIEKRLEAFIRCGHGIIIFPGGVGTMEEILYLLGVMLHPKNSQQPIPIVFTGPFSSAKYFQQIDSFIHATLGPEAQSLYSIIIDEAEAVARKVFQGTQQVKQFRKINGDAYSFNWMLHIDPDFQYPFTPTHDTMKDLSLTLDQPRHKLATNLRKLFSGIVAGNVKAEGIEAIKKKGPYKLHGSAEIMEPLEKLLNSFVEQKRMKISEKDYSPCYEIVDC
jgi:predicted Rossmann-fold nucleotide-binding protein